MTITRFSNNYYEGLTADTKPTNVPAGSIFRDTQTDIYYEYNGSSWDIIIGNTKTETLTNKTLTSPIISTISNIGTITLPTATDTLIGRATTDTLTNKTILDSGTGNQIGVHIPYTFTIYQDASNYIVRNNHTGTLQTFANTDFAPALEWAIDNITNVGLGTQSSLYGGGIFIQRGKYIATSTINPDIDTATVHGVTIDGEGWGTEINLAPAGATTDGFLIDMAAFWLRNMRITANDQVTNLIHVIGHGSGQRRNDHIFFYNLQIEGPNVEGGWNATPHVANQIGILMDGSSVANYYSRIIGCYIHSFEKGISFTGLQTTSCLVHGGALKWCEKGIEISSSSGQIFIGDLYIQGDTFDGTTGIHVTSTAGGYIQIHNVNAEMHRENAGTPVAAQAVLIDSGVANCSVKTVRNAYDGVDAAWKTVVDNAYPTTLNDTPSTINIKNKNFLHFDYDNDLVTLHASRRMTVRSGMFYVQGSNGFNHIFTQTGALAASRIVNLPVLTGNDEFTFNAHTQTLTNKTLTSPVISTISNTGTLTLPTSTDTLVGRATTDTLTNKTISGASNTISNVPDSALSSNVALENITNTFTEAQKIEKTTAGATDTLFTLYKPSNTASDRISFDFSLNNSTPAEKIYGAVRTAIVTNTAGSENGQVEIWTTGSGTLNRRMTLNHNGALTVGPNLRLTFVETGLTGGRTYTFADVSGEVPVRERLTVAAVAAASAFTPAAGFVTIFFNTDDSKLSIKNSSGTTTPVH